MKITRKKINCSAEVAPSPVQASTWMGKYVDINNATNKVYFDLASNDFEEAEGYFADSIPVPFKKAVLLGRAPSIALAEADGFIPLETCTDVENQDDLLGAVDTGLEYWYYTRHGMGPGTIPSGVAVLDWYEEGYDTWVLLDKMLTTEELNDYELKEQTPPLGAVSHNGVAIEGATCTKVSEDDDGIEYVISSVDVDAAEDSQDLMDAIKAEINEGCIQYLTGPHGGFLRPGTPKESRWDMTADEMYVLDVRKEGDQICCEVRAELDYEGLENLIEVLNPIIQQFNKGSYFEPVTSGIIDAYVPISDADEPVSIDGAVSRADDLALARHEDEWLEDDREFKDPEDKNPLVIEFDFDFKAKVDSDGEWEEVGDDVLIPEDVDYSDEGVDRTRMEEDLCELLIWEIPSEEGTYKVSGHAKLYYEYKDEFDTWPTFRIKYSAISDVDVARAGR